MNHPMIPVAASRFGEHLAQRPACPGMAEDMLTAEGRRRIPQLHPHYVFTSEVFDDLSEWWRSAPTEPLVISGPTGSGKTSAVLEWCARLRMPVVSVTARARMDKRELLGRWVLESGAMRWVDGPAALAWRHGWLLLVNEYSAAPPEMWVSANDLLEGLPLEIDQTGEILPKHPCARVVLTDNTRGHAAESGEGYFGRHLQDRSVVDRCWHMRIEGLSEEDEAELLLKTVPERIRLRAGEARLREVCAKLAQAAAESRTAANRPVLGFEARSTAISHRALARMAGIAARYVSGEGPSTGKPVERLADLALGRALEPDVRDALVICLSHSLGDMLERMRAEATPSGE